MTKQTIQKMMIFALAGWILSSGALAMASAKDPFLTETKQERDERMAWWRDARFGMFIHWGLYAVPAGEWKGNRNHAEWIRTTAQIPLETYDKLLSQFNPTEYDPDAWVKMAKDAGMKYIVITSKHHDGFCLWPSKYTDFDIEATPYKGDLLGELKKACDKHDVTLCFYYSIMDWHHPDYLPRLGWEKDRSADGARYDRYIAYMKNQLKELVERYDPAVLWFDGEWEGTWTHEMGIDLYAYVRSLKPDIIINNRVDKGRRGMQGLTREGAYRGDFGTPEQEIPATGIPGMDWETCMTMNGKWGWNKYDKNFKSTEDLVRKLVDIASKGGNFLLNIGPKPDGTFPQESIDRLAGIGDWMEVNGESIYGTSASPTKRPAWGRITTKASGDTTTLYLHGFDWPSDGKLRVMVDNEPAACMLLADKSRQFAAKRDGEDGIVVELKGDAPNAISSTVVLKVKGEPKEIVYRTKANADGVFTLKAAEAVLGGGHDATPNLEEKDASKPTIGFWLDPKGVVSWPIKVDKAGDYEMTLRYAAPEASKLTVLIGNAKLAVSTKPTGSYEAFKDVPLGTLKLGKGAAELKLVPDANAWKPINVSWVMLKPVE